MSGWITFWLMACIVFFGAFALLALVVLPLGFRDLIRLFRHLRSEGEETASREGTSAEGSAGTD